MNRFTQRLGYLLLLAMLLTAGACSDDSPTTPPPGGGEDPGNLPFIPEPTSVNWLPPSQSDELVIGMSSEIAKFEPFVQQLRQMQDDGTQAWNDENRHLNLACEGGLPRNTSNDGAVDGTYISARPHLLHTRFWQLQINERLDVGTRYSEEVTHTWGASTTNTTSTTFSRTMGVEITAGGDYKAFSTDVTAYYEETRTSEEINTVTFSTEDSISKRIEAEGPSSGVRLFHRWQLVDKFSLVDADTIPIDESPTLVHASINGIAPIVFPNETTFVNKTTDFK